MSKARQPQWRYTGSYDASGRPNEFFIGIPARDLDQSDIDAMSDVEYELVEQSSLYKAKTSASSTPTPTRSEKE